MSTAVEPPRRRWSGLRVSGLVISLAAVVLGVVCVVKTVTAVAAPLADALRATPHPTPYSEVLTLDKGSYTVFEQVDPPGVLDEPGDVRLPTLGPAAVTVEADSGGALEVTTPGLSETVDQGSAHFVGFARFRVPEAGDYRVEVSAPQGGAGPTGAIIVAPSLGTGLRAAGGWLAGVGASGLTLLVGLGLLLASFLRGSAPPPVAPQAADPAYAAPTDAAPTHAAPTYAPPPQPPVATPPGWYPDPQAPHLLRYWDGRGWTAHTHPRT